ncbi:class I adenylate-forming enzyme family protein [Aliihoeflea sp. PC F10.4]
MALAQVPSHDERRATIEAASLPRNIADLVRQASADGGDRLAWHFAASAERMSYKDLQPAVWSLAAGLQSIGIGKGTHVAVMLSNTSAMPLAWLALGVLGAVMVPVNNGYSQREVEYIAGNSDAVFIITEPDCLPVVEPAIAGGATALGRENVVVVSSEPHAEYHDFQTLCETDSTGLKLPDVGHEDLLNIQYTSGTTGFPKGCMLSQRYWLSAGKVNAFRDGRRYERIFASTPFYYMDPQWLLLMSFYQRATLIVERRQSASRFIGWLREHQIEFCLLPTLVLKQPASEEDRENAIIRSNVYGVPTHVHAELEERFDLCARECFGMTELGPTLYVPIEATEMVGSGSCGIPCSFRECRVVDEHGNDVATGTVGELIVRGPGILQGYYNNPEATAAAFYGEWFRTGDLFRQDERGYFYIVGRVKDTIRRSGENIAAREVEAVLTSHPLVREAAAVPVKDDVRGEEIKAIIVWQAGATGSRQNLDTLIDHCVANLAAFKVPRFFETCIDIPKTGSGKIAKHMLVDENRSPVGAIFDRRAADGGKLHA